MSIKYDFLQYTYFLLTSAKLICHFKKLLFLSSQHRLILKCAKFQCHDTYNSEVTGRVFLTILFQTKSTTPVNPNNIGLTFSPKTKFVCRTKADFQHKSQDTKLTENCKKACLAVLLKFILIMTAPQIHHRCYALLVL